MRHEDSSAALLREILNNDSVEEVEIRVYRFRPRGAPPAQAESIVDSLPPLPEVPEPPPVPVVSAPGEGGKFAPSTNGTHRNGKPHAKAKTKRKPASRRKAAKAKTPERTDAAPSDEQPVAAPADSSREQWLRDMAAKVERKEELFAK